MKEAVVSKGMKSTDTQLIFENTTDNTNQAPRSKSSTRRSPSLMKTRS